MRREYVPGSASAPDVVRDPGEQFGALFSEITLLR